MFFPNILIYLLFCYEKFNISTIKITPENKFFFFLYNPVSCEISKINLPKMKEAVIVSTARSGIGKAYKGAFNATQAPTLAGHVIKEAVKRAGVDPAEVDDCIMGCAMPQGTTGANVGRMVALAGGLPVTVSGMTIDRQCSSGMMANCDCCQTNYG